MRCAKAEWQASSSLLSPSNQCTPSKGLIGDLATVHVTYRSGSGPDAFVIKLPAANPGSRQIGDMLHAYAREVAFYRDVAPQATATQLAKCFYAGADEQQHRWAVILEAIDSDEFDVMAGATTAQAAAAVDALADFHARWWDADAPFEWMPGFDVTRRWRSAAALAGQPADLRRAVSLSAPRPHS